MSEGSTYISRETTLCLKAFSIFTIIVGHMISCTGIFKDGALTFMENFSEWILSPSVGMGIFMFVSGYGLYQSYQQRGLEKYWESKVSRIIFPFFVVQSIWYLHAYFTGGLVWTKIERVGSLLGLWPLNVFDESMWYISYQLFWYFVFFVSFYLLREKGIFIIGFVGLLCSAGLGNLWIYYNIQFCFVVGVLFSILDKKYHLANSRLGSKEWIFAILLYIGSTELYLLYPNKYVQNVFMIFRVISCIVVIRKITTNNTVINQVGLGLGEISYYLYLFEMKLIADLSKKIVYQNNLMEYWGVIYVGLSIGAIGVAFAALKIDRYLRNIFKKNNSKLSKNEK